MVRATNSINSALRLKLVIVDHTQHYEMGEKGTSRGANEPHPRTNKSNLGGGPEGEGERRGRSLLLLPLT